MWQIRWQLAMSAKFQVFVKHDTMKSKRNQGVNQFFFVPFYHPKLIESLWMRIEFIPFHLNYFRRKQLTKPISNPLPNGRPIHGKSSQSKYLLLSLKCTISYRFALLFLIHNFIQLKLNIDIALNILANLLPTNWASCMEMKNSIFITMKLSS